MRVKLSKLAILLVAIFICSCSQKAPVATGAKPIFVKFKACAKQNLDIEFETAGELKADKEITVAAERSGQLQELYVKEGAWVNKGQVIAKIKGEDVDADYKLAKADYDTFKKLYDQGAIAYQDLLKYTANLDRINSQKDNLLIRAISEGKIAEIFVDPGDYLMTGAKILDLVKNYPLRVSYFIPEKLIPKLALGQALVLTTDADSAKAYVDFISPKVEVSTRGVLVRATLSNPAANFKANQFVNIKQLLSSMNVLVVQEEAIALEQGEEFVYIAEALDQPEPSTPQGPGATHIAKKMKVETGFRKPGLVEIKSGIKEGDLVIYAGLTSIYPDAKLINVEQ
ncbi:MAG: efflux RND transporter periplasmic adaptor subunit [Candidatus Caenarcaniphilales bacterium]|jgi:membrane fusion protein (multidrug efflux system)|nr:efflux RND transporter periplasmic adaptor subunit [Candidatus Caenarcaniphilales bacterium]